MGGSRAACIHLTRLVEPGEWETWYHQSDTTESRPHERNPPSYTGDVSTFIRAQTNVTFWAAAPGPEPTVPGFAIATSHGTALAAESQSSWSIQRLQNFKREDGDGASSEVLAVDWLDTNVVLSGCRDSTVTLWDTRASGGGATSRPVRHASCINHVRRLDGSRIVVAGLERRMASYDLRYLRPAADGAVTRPYVEFSAYGNGELNGVAVGFDVCGDLVAAGTDEAGVQLFEGPSGRRVRAGVGGEMGEVGVGGPARCVRFVEMEGRREGRTLFAAGEGGIEQWVW